MNIQDEPKVLTTGANFHQISCAGCGEFLFVCNRDVVAMHKDQDCVEKFIEKFKIFVQPKVGV